MLYNSLSYLGFFVAVFGLVWSLRGHRARLIVLLVASWLFYAAWYPKYLLLFLVVTLVTYGAGIAIGTPGSRLPRWRHRVLVATIVADLGMLAYFKYANFLLETIGGIAGTLGLRHPHASVFIILPLGISFYTFQSIAYVVDVYRGEVSPIRNPLKLALFKAFFPQLIAGPIVRADELVPQFASPRRLTAAGMRDGMDLVMLGLFKKVVVADHIAVFADQVFAQPSGLGSVVLLLGVYSYAAQIYCDFSGYTDIGRGCARLLGYELPLNFNSPYLSVNIVDFWRRWHMSLSRWLRDYLYIPLGGSRRGPVRTYVNLFITMLLGGLWHGASWTFVAWGAMHGIALAITRWVHDWRGVAGERPLFSGRVYHVVAVLMTFNIVCFAWILFRAPTFGVALAVMQGISRLSGVGAADVGRFGWVTLGIVATSLALLYALHLLGQRRILARSSGWTAVALRSVFYAAVVIGVTLASTGGTQQFIYFQF